MLSFDRELVGDRPFLPATEQWDLRGAGFTDRGPTGRSNEDCFRIDDALGLLVVADGVGGLPGGAVASHLTVEEVAEWVGRTEYARVPDPGSQGSLHWHWPYGYDRALSLDENRLRTAIYSAHVRLVEETVGDRSLTGMGTTVVAAIERAGRLSVAWAGDSRLYLLQKGRLRRLTRDDTWVERERSVGGQLGLVDDRRTLRDHPLGHALTNAVGSGARIQVHVTSAAVQSGDVVSLTTDGVHAWLPDATIGRLISRGTGPRDAAADLVAAAIGCGSTDNCTAVVARV
jgi:serine/threonine protein phosphatase PrpC